MKKITMILMMMAVLLLSVACTDEKYNIGKKIYLGAKTIVQSHSDKLSDDTKERLKKLDAVAKAYDSNKTGGNK